MARYKLTAVTNIYGTVKTGDVIYVNVPHESAINTEIVRKALDEQLGKRMNSGYYWREWDIVKL